jgi:hypothetical protein
MTGYFAWPVLVGDPPRDASPIAGLAEPPERKFLSTTVHMFQITADNKSYKVLVCGSDVEVIDMPSNEGALPKPT